ncbi:MAG: hypothetical protein ACERKV_01030 [Clostridiaceae bacterium]
MAEKEVSLFKNKKGNNISFRPEDLIEARYKLSSKENDIVDMVLTKIEDDTNTRYNLKKVKLFLC